MRLIACIAAVALATMAGWASAQPLTAEDLAPEAVDGQLDPVVQVTRDLRYGDERGQRLDVYRRADTPPLAPVIVLVHGGAWMAGDRSRPGFIVNKANHWTAAGHVVVSVDYPLWPRADIAAQVQSLRGALGYVVAQSGAWGGDPTRIVAIGHSAGAHLLGLLAADPQVTPLWRGMILLDSAAYDLTELMAAPHARFYDRVFGDDPAYWAASSPTHLATPGRPPVLLVCSTRRTESCGQARDFDAAMGGDGSAILPVDMTHSQISVDAGARGAYTEALDAFLKSVLD